MQVANDKPPDIILLDMMLPKISGPEVLRALKANPATMDIPVIVLTRHFPVAVDGARAGRCRRKRRDSA